MMKRSSENLEQVFQTTFCMNGEECGSRFGLFLVYVFISGAICVACPKDTVAVEINGAGFFAFIFVIRFGFEQEARGGRILFPFLGVLIVEKPDGEVFVLNQVCYREILKRTVLRVEAFEIMGIDQELGTDVLQTAFTDKAFVGRIGKGGKDGEDDDDDEQLDQREAFL